MVIPKVLNLTEGQHSSLIVYFIKNAPFHPITLIRQFPSLKVLAGLFGMNMILSVNNIEFHI